MGQAPLQKAQEASPIHPGVIHSKLNKHASELKQIVTLPYETFLESVQEINKITQSFSDINGKQLHFSVKKETDTTIFWKGTVRIRCHKVNCRTGAIETSRLLNLKQYIHLYNEITQQSATATLQTADAANLCASVILTELDNAGVASGDENECCICMDRKAEVILTCSHMYCEQCIDEWNVNHKTCPICRATVKGSDDTWVLTEKPDHDEMVYETRGYLIGLADRTGSPAQGSADH